MSRLFAATTLVFSLGAPAYANELDDQIAVQFAENAQAGNGGKCFHACSPCDYAPGSGAHLDYDRHHKVKLSTKCNWSASRLYPNN